MTFSPLRHAAVLVALATASLYGQQRSVFTTGLIAPEKMILGPGRTLLVAEAGNAANGGRVSIVSSVGTRRSLLQALPAGLSAEGTADGPNGMVLDENTLYLSIGEGDQLVAGAARGTNQPNPKGPASPILASILKIVFSQPVDQISAPFTLRAADHNTLADGGSVMLDNLAGATATISVLSDFRYRPDPVAIYRNTHPYSLAKNPTDANTLYLGDSGQNSIVQVNAQTGRWRVLTRFAPQPNRVQPGPPVAEAVPDSIRFFNGRLLVTLLTGFPFGAGNSKVMSVDPVTGASEVFIDNLTSSIDILPRSRFLRPLQYFVLEHSANLLAGAPGRVKLVGPGTTTAVIADNLNAPTTMFYDTAANSLFIASRVDGTIVKLDLQN
jgi:hypothetical protein